MANLIISKSEIEKHLKLNSDVIEKINMFGLPAELKNDELNLEVLANRPDLLSMQGFLRAFNAYSGKETGLKKYKVNAPEKNYKVKIDPGLEKIRPYTACAIVKGLKLSEANIKEIINIQEKLHLTVGRNRKKAAIGIYPLEKITLPIKFEAKKPSEIRFIPLEMNEEMNALQILQRHPAGREYAKLLDGLEKYPVFLDNKGKVLSMPPVINSHETGKITSETKEVFIECSGFDFNVLNKILNIIVTALADMGGKIYSMELDYGKKLITPDLTPEKMKINIENVNKLSGLDLKEKDIEKLLPRMGYDYKNGNVIIPAWRGDILHEVDIIEDIMIAYGYNKLIPEVSRVASVGSESKESKIESKIAEILTGLGLIEISTYHLIKEEENEDKTENIEVYDSKTEYKVLRPNLVIPALRILSENKDNEYPQKIFEIGNVFEKSAQGDIVEKQKLVVAFSPSNFTNIKQTLDYLNKMLSVDIKIEEFAHQSLIDGRSASVVLNKNKIGFIGEVHPEVLRKKGIKMPVSLFEIELDSIKLLI